MLPPKRYFVWHEDAQKIETMRAANDGNLSDDCEPDDISSQHSFDSLAQARKFAGKLSKMKLAIWGIYERYDITDVTPEEDPPGLIWDWNERMIDEE
jgi:hypothetical protein